MKALYYWATKICRCWPGSRGGERVGSVACWHRRWADPLHQARARFLWLACLAQPPPGSPIAPPPPSAFFPAPVG